MGTAYVVSFYDVARVVACSRVGRLRGPLKLVQASDWAATGRVE
jgi:hypothetical protein